MSLGSKTQGKLTGTNIVQAFLGELTGFLYGVPGNSYTGSPREVVESVIANTDRFANCDEGCIDTLSRQLVMAVKGVHGQKFKLACETVSRGMVTVSVI